MSVNISPAALEAKCREWQKTNAGKTITKQVIKEAADGKRTLSLGNTLTSQQAQVMANDLAKMIRSSLPKSIAKVGSSLNVSAPKLVGGKYLVELSFNPQAIHRESLDPYRYPGGIDNIVALFNTGYDTGGKIVIGVWDGHTQFSDPDADLYDQVVKSLPHRDALHFMQDAISKWVAKYSGDNEIEVTLAPVYT